MLDKDADNLSASVVAFCRFLRPNGIASDVRQTLAALEVTATIGIADRQLFACALRSVLCSSQQEWKLFQPLFDAFWNDAEPRENLKPRPEAERRKTKSPRPPIDSSFLLGVSSQEASGKAVSGASAQQQLKKVDFSEVPYDDLSQLEQLAQRLLQQMNRRLSRRLTLKKHMEHLDLRRTIRQSIRFGGNPLLCAYKGRKLRRTRLVVLLDISGSMNSYSLFLVRFLYALQRAFQRVDTFLFSTNLIEITDLLRTRHLRDALRRLSQRAAGWSGGTKIGESLREFNGRYAGRLLTHNTTLIILSDGWDTGEPEILGAELRFAKRRVQRVVWLNPLLGMKDYQPITRSMAAALHYVDVFAPAHNLESLLSLEGYL